MSTSGYNASGEQLPRRVALLRSTSSDGLQRPTDPPPRFIVTSDPPRRHLGPVRSNSSDQLLLAQLRQPPNPSARCIPSDLLRRNLRSNSSKQRSPLTKSRSVGDFTITNSGGSQDSASRQPRRGGKRPLTSIAGSSFRSKDSLSGSLHCASSFREKNYNAQSNSPYLRKSALMISSIWLVSLCCSGGILYQCYVVFNGRLDRSLTSSDHKFPLSSLPITSPRHSETNEGSSRRKSDKPVKENAPKARSMFEKNTDELTAFQKQHGTSSVRRVITAYAEPAMQDTVPGTGSRDNPDDQRFGIVPEFKIPLPRRTTTPANLKKYLYPAAQTCHDLPAKFPVDKGLQFDAKTGQPIAWNLGQEATPPDFPKTETAHCPVEIDPFLPWIHDVFAAVDGSKIDFIAQNMRRCRTGREHTDNVNRLVPQVALMQAVSVQRINETKARELAPDLWQDSTSNSARYRLAPWAEASEDGTETRFICRFHTSRVDDVSGGLSTVWLGETLSVFPFNYELLSYRKNIRSMLTPRGNDGGYFWTSTLHFHCPVPDDKHLRRAIASGSTVLKDGTATVHVDLVPIRTSVRFEEIYLTPDQIGPEPDAPTFDPVKRWGPDHVLPHIEASGRWANIPICSPPKPSSVRRAKSSKDKANGNVVIDNKSRVINPDLDVADDIAAKQHFLSACLWASAEFKTRGQSKSRNTDTLKRLNEWIEFHLLVGFDHIYVYDNSGAHTNETSLEPILGEYPSSKVSRIDWPMTVCNNNKPSADSAGERSSQYAAESSCRARYGPHSEWLASFDTDEYFVPMGNYTNLKDVLSDAQLGGANILSFRSTRGKLRRDKSGEVYNGTAIQKSPSALFLDAYNCDSAGSPKPTWANRARKQIYRPDYVMHHFVHYSTATRGLLTSYKKHQEQGRKWIKRYREVPPSEVFSNEFTQAVMVHTKSIMPDMTEKYKSRCQYNYTKKGRECWVASPWPNGKVSETKIHDIGGMKYNCFVNTKVDEYWMPRLLDALSNGQNLSVSSIK